MLSTRPYYLEGGIKGTNLQGQAQNTPMKADQPHRGLYTSFGRITKFWLIDKHYSSTYSRKEAGIGDVFNIFDAGLLVSSRTALM